MVGICCVGLVGALSIFPNQTNFTLKTLILATPPPPNLPHFVFVLGAGVAVAAAAGDAVEPGASVAVLAAEGAGVSPLATTLVASLPINK